jgi:hypothetical protein
MLASLVGESAGFATPIVSTLSLLKVSFFNLSCIGHGVQGFT